MWLAEVIFVVGFFVAGAALMPTPQSDAVARKRGNEESNRRKRDTIRRALADYKNDNPGSQWLYRASVVLFVVGVGLVLLFDISAPESGLSTASTVMIVVGYILQAVALATFVSAAIAKRRFVTAALRDQGVGPASG
jgi:protein-S-isoprenylcysteine O-methyltransferase Ste14